MFDVLERITYYRKMKKWTEYQLAEEADLTQSTISSWYRKNMVPSISSLEKYVPLLILHFHNFSEEHDTFTLTPLQHELINSSTCLSETQQKALLQFLKTL